MTRPADSALVLRARRAYAVVAVWIPLGLTALAVALMLVWLPEVPSTIAVHWGAGGQPDGFGPAWAAPVLAALVGAGLAALFGAIGHAAGRTGEWGPTVRFLGALGCGTTTLVLVLVTASFAAQRGLTDAGEAAGIAVPLLAGLGAGAAAGVGAWFAQPAVAVSGGSRSAAVPEVALAPGEHAAWFRTTTMSRPAMIAIIGVTLLMAVLAVATGLLGGELWWVFCLLAIVFAVLTATSCVFRVSVTESGLRVRSIAGLPRFGVALTDVESVAVVRVEPMAEFGGWGFRLGLDGRFGIVLHAGEAIQVVRREGRPFLVTVDDAATGAGLLSALAARSRAGRP